MTIRIIAAVVIVVALGLAYVLGREREIARVRRLIP